jgi:hypothetical protein
LRETIVPDHWMRQFYRANVYQRLQMLINCVDAYNNIAAAGFGMQPYIVAQIAAAQYGLQGM